LYASETTKAVTEGNGSRKSEAYRIVSNRIEGWLTRQNPKGKTAQWQPVNKGSDGRKQCWEKSKQSGSQRMNHK
jgi:hypothetical protein